MHSQKSFQFSLILLLSFLSVSAFGQNNAIKALREAQSIAFANYAQALDGERIYVHTDRPRYLPGETIWFQTYVRADADLGPAHQSEIVHLELIGPRGNTVKKRDIQIENGLASGDLQLSGNLPGGIYKLKAFTRWQQNETDPFYFEKELMLSKAVYPALKLKLDLDREAYGPGDEVIIEVKMESLANQPLADKELSYSVKLAGKEVKTGSSRSNQQGKGYVSLILPESLSSSDGLVNILVHHDGKTESISRSIPIVLNNLRVELFPEGGDLVTGIPSKVAFQAWNEHNKPADFSGILVDSYGKTLTSFKSYHMGMGSFEFTPQAGEKYAVQITRPQGVSGTFPIPQSLPQGFSLSLDHNHSQRITASINSSYQNAPAILMGQIRGKVYFSQTLELSQGKAQVSIPTHKMPPGVLQVTLMDASGIGQAERLAFVNKSELLNIEIETDQQEYLPREKVSLKIRTKNSAGKGVSARVSLAVVNDRVLSFADDKQGNILSSMLLEADVKGKVEEPSFYFDPEEAKADLALDLLLMTRGWRKFEWKKVNEAPIASIFPEKASYRGHVYDINGEPLAGVEFYAHGNRRKTYSQKDGSFSIPKDLFASKNDVVRGYKEGYLSQNFYLNPSARQLALFLAPNAVKFARYDQAWGNVKVCYSDKVFNQYSGLEAMEYSLKGPFSNKKPNPILGIDPNLHTVNKVLPDWAKPKVAPVSGPVSSTNLERGLPPFEISENGVEMDAVTISANSHIESLNAIEVLAVNSYCISRSDPWQYGLIQYHIEGQDYWVGDGLGIRLTNIPRIGNVRPSPPRSVPPKLRNYQEIQDKIGSHPAIASGKVMGKVKYRILVGKKGQIQKVIPLAAGNPELFEASKWHVQNLDFKAGWATGKRIPIWTTVEFNFIPAGANPVANFSPKGNFQRARTFYSPVYASTENAFERSDYRETLFWKGDIQTDEQGEAKVIFYNSDEVTSFRAIAEGISENVSGTSLPGRAEATFHTQLPLSLEARLPNSVSTGDLVRVPLTLKNNSNSDISGKIKISYPSLWSPVSSLPKTLDVKANSLRIEYLDFKVNSGEGEGRFFVKIEAAGIQESIEKKIRTEKKGFPQEVFVSGSELDQAWNLKISKPIEGSLSAQLTVYTNVLAETMEGMKSMLRYPSGCFEQTTSKNWPNLLVTRYLIESESDDLATKKTAIEFLRKGYQRLAGFEASSGGFDWYGRSPGNLRLSAYGLLQFSLTDKLIGGVNQKMVHRTEKWILSHRDQKGNFISRGNRNIYKNQNGQEVTNAYLIFALARSGFKELDIELQFALENVRKNKDPYQIALLANACIALENSDQAEELIEMLVRLQTKDGKWQGKTRSMVGSSGNALATETTALACIALMGHGNPDHLGIVGLGIKYLYRGRNPYGSFGATQTTVMALEALIDYQLYNQRNSEDGKLELLVNGKVLEVVEYKSNQQGIIKLDAWHNSLRVGNNHIQVRFSETKHGLPFSLGANWTTQKPSGSREKEVSLKMTLAKSQVKVGETVRITSVIRNLSREAIGTPIALIGIPGGLSVQDWQLKELKEKGLFDFYELRGQYVVLYYESMRGMQSHEINLDLKAEVPGNFEAPASSAYPYYNQTQKDWASLGSIEILP